MRTGSDWAASLPGQQLIRSDQISQTCGIAALASWGSVAVGLIVNGLELCDKQLTKWQDEEHLKVPINQLSPLYYGSLIDGDSVCPGHVRYTVRLLP